MLYGADVSEFQGTIDWDLLNANANFVFIRASFGTARRDNQFDRNQSEARRVRDSAGPLGIGYYYYAYPTLLDPTTSADYFLDNLDYQPGEALALDLEGNIGTDPVGWAKGFLDHVHDRTGVKPLIYLNQSEITEHDWTPVIEAGYGLWLADYDGNKEGPGVATPWPVTAVRQWTDADFVPGISGAVDGCVFYGDFAQWNAYCDPQTPPQSIPAEPTTHPSEVTSPAPVSEPIVQDVPVEAKNPADENVKGGVFGSQDNTTVVASPTLPARLTFWQQFRLWIIHLLPFLAR